MKHPSAECGQGSGGHVLDNPVYAALHSPEHVGLARGQGRVLRYQDDVSPFMGLPENPTDEDWIDAAHLVGSGSAYVHRSELIPPAWNVVDSFKVLQMTASGVEEGAPDPRVSRLDAADITEMLDLAHRTNPGPFFARTIEMGTYLGIRHDGVLAAMAGERMLAPGWVEISAVCTAPEYRGKGLGSSLITTLAARIAARGSRAFLHVAATNTGAIHLYEALGFGVRCELTVTVLRGPDTVAFGAS